MKTRTKPSSAVPVTASHQVRGVVTLVCLLNIELYLGTYLLPLWTVSLVDMHNEISRADLSNLNLKASHKINSLLSQIAANELRIHKSILGRYLYKVELHLFVRGTG